MARDTFEGSIRECDDTTAAEQGSKRATTAFTRQDDVESLCRPWVTGCSIAPMWAASSPKR